MWGQLHGVNTKTIHVSPDWMLNSSAIGLNYNQYEIGGGNKKGAWHMRC